VISTTTVRQARADDRDPALATLVAAFTDDPLARHLFGDRETLSRHLPAFFGYLLEVSLEGCEVLVTNDLSAASLWTPPGGNRLGAEVLAERWQEVLPGMPTVFEERYARFGALVEPAVPERRHWHLGVLGVRPDRQRRGLGTSVCVPMLARADGEAMPVLLETATPSNLPFYGRLGFTVRRRTDLPGGPPVWTMWRKPAAVA
jgi:ribosomal protein S18 acetylase RimI-like enzyme